MGGIVFLDLRDRSGLVQVSFDPAFVDADTIRAAGSVGRESVVLVEGEVVARPAAMRNAEMATGEIEVKASSLRVVGPADTPAIPVALGKGETLPSEELRLRHRVLDLRRPEMQRQLILRHRLMQVTRQYLSELGFLEIETPILTKPTPEGARDYLVPSRVHPGEFYALPQSPQIYKQLLMVAGFDRYFQIARCFRDEDLRADRQPEFTQIDIEASFVGPGRRVRVHGGDDRGALGARGATPRTPPFSRMTYAEAMERFGSDRPDLRYGLELYDASELFRATDFAIARSALDAGGRVRGLSVPGGGALSRKQVDELEAIAKSAGAAGLLRVKREAGALTGPAAKFLGAGAGDALKLRDGDLALLVAGPEHVTNPALDRVRQEVARRDGLVPANAQRFVWITDFPLLRTRPRPTGALTAVHHPFTAPNPEDLPFLERTPRTLRARSRTISCCNGTELGGGSIRITDPALQNHGVHAARHSMTRRRSGASDSCSRGCGRARRRMAASRSASTASR